MDLFIILVALQLIIGGGLFAMAYYFGISRGAAKAKRETEATAASNRLETALSRIESLKD